MRLPLTAILVLALTRTASADLQPPPVVLELSGQPTALPGKPFLLPVRVTNRTGLPVQGAVTISTSRPLELVAPRSPMTITVPATSQQIVNVPLSARTELSTQELRITWESTEDTPATLRLFVRGTANGQEWLTLRQLIERQSTGLMTRAGHSYLLFPVKGGAPEIGKAGKAGRLTVKGKITAASSKGEQLPARRATASLQTAGESALATAIVAEDGSFSLETDATAATRKMTVTFATENTRWNVQDPSEKTYAWTSASFDAASGEVDLGALEVPAGQPAAEAFWIHHHLNKALDTFEKNGFSGELAWWTKIPVNWPADADYFSWGSVNVTLAQQWDVVGHEFGHAIFHYGSSARSSGGSHKIDQCYSNTLAWSEGWASYFSAVCHIAADDADAKFEFMVPRRKPIRIENVPDDVCHGQTSEWRVSAALWDLHDTHVDGADTISLGFPIMWRVFRDGQSLGSLQEYVTALKQKVDAAQRPIIDAVMRANTIDP